MTRQLCKPSLNKDCFDGRSGNLDLRKPLGLPKAPQSSSIDYISQVVLPVDIVEDR